MDEETKEKRNTLTKDDEGQSKSNTEEHTKDEKDVNTTSTNDENGNRNENEDEDETEAEVGLETVSSSSTSECSSASGEDEKDDGVDEFDDELEMPLLKYARIVGSLPRSSLEQIDEENDVTPNVNANANANAGKPLSKACKFSVMGKVTITPSSKSNEMGMPSVSALGLSIPLSDSSHGTSALTSEAQTAQDEAFMSRYQTFLILAMAMEDGTIHMVDPRTGIHICPPNQMKVYPGSGKPDIVALSFDASGTYLAALTAGGDVAIFEFRFGITIHPNGVNASAEQTKLAAESKPAERRPEFKAFDSFLSRLAGDDWSTTSKDTTTSQNATITKAENDATSNTSGANGDASNNIPSPTLPTLKLTHPISTARFSHKSSASKISTATCITLDPSYKRKREKCVIVGFSNGRLIYTKRSGHGGVVADGSGLGGVMGNLLQPKRSDVDLFQGIGSSGNTGGAKYDGIECIAWRGTLVSWADASGIKLFDIEKMTRIAHIDRPTGARTSLYPGVSSLKPTLVFEQSDSLLIAWGDCLMNMTIKEEVQRTNSDSILSQSGKVTKRTVKCANAWQLDCVACGVVPMDSEHVAVLGLVPNPDSDDGATGGRLVELQVVCRSNGTIVQSDILPLIRPEGWSEAKDVTSEFVLTSSFATPRMEDSFEAEEEEYMNEEIADFDIQSMLNMDIGSSFLSSPTLNKFVNPHMKWDIASYKNVISSNFVPESQEDDEESSLESSNSEYSDDYTFLFRPKKSSKANNTLLWKVPSMVITSPHDAVLVQTRDVDDSIEYARSYGNYGLALRRGLDHRQIIRRHNFETLIDEYFSAILFQSDAENSSLLTINRLKIAARATEILFGGKVKMWDHWVNEFAKIPGALFLLRPHLPTRDPKLPNTLYEMIIVRMFTELEGMFTRQNENQNYEIQQQLKNNAIDLFLETLRAWGPMSSLKNRIKLHRITINDDYEDLVSQTRLFDEAEIAFTRRMDQTAEHYLKLQRIAMTARHQADDLVHSANLPSGITFDSLFRLDVVTSSFETKLDQITVEPQDNRIHTIVLEVLAETNFMKGLYKECLYNYLALASFIDHPISLIEEEALESVVNSTTGKASNDRYKHVLTIIETYDLHRALLKSSNGLNDYSEALPPLVCLICIIGLKESGHFILQHCTLPRSTRPPTPSMASENRSDLPINQVAAQFNPYPKLLHWFLQMIFLEKPEIYVQFPNTAVPPSAVTDLHRIHFNLHVDYADRSFDETKKLTAIPTFDELKYESPLMKFLKAALPHGGIRSDDVRKTLERCRSDSDRPDSKVKYPHLFAHELAFVIERSGSGSEDDAKEVLTLYLEGVVSLPLAVEYVERHTSFSTILWEALISYCLNAKIDEPSDNDNDDGRNGQLFGSLLEVAARSGADLAHLVSKIPTGMSIHGIRSKLVTAISDYRFKLKINEDAAKILSDDKVSLLREQCHRSRRGVRIDLMRDVEKSSIKRR